MERTASAFRARTFRRTRAATGPFGVAGVEEAVRRDGLGARFAGLLGIVLNGTAAR